MNSRRIPVACLIAVLGSLIVAPVFGGGTSSFSSISSVDCGAGLHTYTGSHTGTLLWVSFEQEGGSWSVRGTLYLSRFGLDAPKTTCEALRSVQNSDTTMTCVTQADMKCDDPYYASTTTSIGGDGASTSDHDSSIYVACDEPASI